MDHDVLSDISTFVDYGNYNDGAIAMVGQFARVSNLIYQVVVVHRVSKDKGRLCIVGPIVVRRLFDRVLSYRAVQREGLKVFFGLILRSKEGRPTGGNGASGCGPVRTRVFLVCGDCAGSWAAGDLPGVGVTKSRPSKV